MELQFDVSYWFEERGNKKERNNALETYLEIVKGKFGEISQENAAALVRTSSVFAFF